jgi:hypothetical protein
MDNVIVNVPHPSLLLSSHDELARSTFLILTQDITRDIIYQQMNIHLQYTVVADLDSVFLGSARTFSTLEKTK